MIDALDIRVRGIVQGVGFRPFVYRMAKRYLVNGWVLNDKEGVFIHAEAEPKLMDGFVMEIADNAPAAAQVAEVELKEVPLQDCDTFEIRLSDSSASSDPTLVSADLATCPDCLRELFDPADRRYRYPFINCTNCGPRFTIMDHLPYDRPATSMAAFEMCPTCRTEYADPADRRFHAQPDACWECGPTISFAWLHANEAAAGDGLRAPSPAPAPVSLTQGMQVSCDGEGCASPMQAIQALAGLPFADVPLNQHKSMQVIWGDTRERSDALFAAAVDVLASGGILAVKGLGGFHLACDAENPAALAALRERKQRDGKAFAVMVSSVAAARCVCVVSDAEAEALLQPARPIVLLRKRPDAHFAAGLADGLPELGVMLPATPVQHLLLHDWQERTGGTLLVMTSGNRHDDPIAMDDAQAYGQLGSIADAFLGNNRPIRTRYDDSVLRILHTGSGDVAQMIRRARGYAPVPIAMGSADAAVQIPASTGGVSRGEGGCYQATPALLAVGSEQKATFAYALGGKAFVSPHIGDLENAAVFDAWLDAKASYERLFGVEPAAYACDMHPEYVAAKWAHSASSAVSMPLIEVQHHHAHIASVLGEHGLDGPVCGIAFDGTGYGADGAIWGGEVLLANRADYERFANFVYFPLPGGTAAIRHPLRCAYGLLWACDLLDHPAAQKALDALGHDTADFCDHMIQQGMNTPMTSSLGRIFDAISALLGICAAPTYEGEAAVLLDAAAEAALGAKRREVSECSDLNQDAYVVSFTKNAAGPGSTAHDTSVLLMDPTPALSALLDDMRAGVPAGTIALRFHGAVMGAVVQAAELVRALYDISTVALSGGVFMNRLIAERSISRLRDAGFTVALNADLPPNDGCISYGQAVAACARTQP